MGFRVDGTVYTVDMDRFMDFVAGIDDEEYRNTTVTQTYARDPGDDEMSLLSKEIMENRLNANDSMVQIRYDFAKTLLDNVMGVASTENTSSSLTFGQKLAINTLVDYGIINVKKMND